MIEIRFWVGFTIPLMHEDDYADICKNPDERGQLYRSDAIVDTKPGISRFQQATLHQGMSLSSISS
jgi:hypothetical protein